MQGSPAQNRTRHHPFRIVPAGAATIIPQKAGLVMADDFFFHRVKKISRRRRIEMSTTWQGVTL
jgi:hypothetical protein